MAIAEGLALRLRCLRGSVDAVILAQVAAEGLQVMIFGDAQVLKLSDTDTADEQAEAKCKDADDDRDILKGSAEELIGQQDADHGP